MDAKYNTPLVRLCCSALGLGLGLDVLILPLLSASLQSWYKVYIRPTEQNLKKKLEKPLEKCPLVESHFICFYCNITETLRNGNEKL